MATMRRAVFQRRAGAATLKTWNGAKTAARSQEIPSRVMLVLPISRDVAGGPRGLVFSPGGYGVVLEAQIYTRQGGTNLVQTNNGCQVRRITETTAARGDDPKTTAARGVDISAGIVTGMTVTGITVTGITVTGVFLHTRDFDWYCRNDWCDTENGARGDTQTYRQTGMLVLLMNKL